MSALDKIVAHNVAPAERLHLDVPEWDNLRIWYRKTKLNDVAEALRAAPNNPIRQNVEMLVLIAEGEDGKRMFQRLDVLELMEKADPEVIGRVMLEMGIVRQSRDETEKN